jgi:GT2 family glycosyltransferase
MNLVTTILTVTDRLEYLESQLESINNQTINSDIIIHWNTDSEYDLDYPAIIYRNQHKSEPLYNRFISSLNITTPYVFICDDDILPGKKYLERCLNFSKNKNVCITSCGMSFDVGETEYNVSRRIGQTTFPSSPVQVHMGGQGYFFKTELLRRYCDYKIHDDKWGEDIHLGFVCYKENIPTYVLSKDKNDKDTWQDLNLGKRGDDEMAQWRYPTHKIVRDKLMKIYTSLGWEFKKSVL